MRGSSKTWGIRQGDPTKSGTAKIADGYNFTFRSGNGRKLELLFYRKGEEEPEQIIEVPEECRFGEISAIAVLRRDLSAYEYCYRLDGELCPDRNARIVCRSTTFGEKLPKENAYRAQILKGTEVTSLKKRIPYEDMILYKVHVRGYTRQKNSGVRKKGTFGGLKEKIPYWKELGITSLELMPAYEFQEYPKPQKKKSRYQEPEPEVKQVNYWGYDKGAYFAPKAAYAKPGQAENEMKELISAAHEEGLEVLMDFFFPLEIDPQEVLEILRFWKLEYKIDGFVLLGDGVWLELLARDAILADAKLICPGWDMKPLYEKQFSPVKRLGEYNIGYQNVMRRFLKGDEDQVESFLFYNGRNPFTHGVIHYMVSQDGFTLADMVSYDSRHNEDNGEGNRDGSSANYSWNCGIEGPTRKQTVCKLRRRQMRNAMLILLLGQGTPMIYGGDEFGNSQNGNNNAYCQDNEIGWLDWGAARKNADFTDFVKELIAFRKAHRILHMPRELRSTDYKSLGWPEVSYHSERAWFANRECDSRSIGVLYCGAYAKEVNGEKDDFIYVIYNMHWNEHMFAVPNLPEGMKWHMAIDSGKEGADAIAKPGSEIVLDIKKSLKVEGRTILVLIGKAPEGNKQEKTTEKKIIEKNTTEKNTTGK